MWNSDVKPEIQFGAQLCRDEAVERGKNLKERKQLKKDKEIGHFYVKIMKISEPENYGESSENDIGTWTLLPEG